MKQLFFSLLLILSINQVTSQNCPAYSNSTQGTNEACGNQNYTLMIPNTGCNGEIYLTISRSMSFFGDWSLESILTGNTVASQTSYALLRETVNQLTCPLDPNAHAPVFKLIVTSSS